MWFSSDVLTIQSDGKGLKLLLLKFGDAFPLNYGQNEIISAVLDSSFNILAILNLARVLLQCGLYENSILLFLCNHVFHM